MISMQCWVFGTKKSPWTEGCTMVAAEKFTSSKQSVLQNFKSHFMLTWVVRMCAQRLLQCKKKTNQDGTTTSIALHMCTVIGPLFLFFKFIFGCPPGCDFCAATTQMDGMHSKILQTEMLRSTISLDDITPFAHLMAPASFLSLHSKI